jgi:hypothetical protein
MRLKSMALGAILAAGLHHPAQAARYWMSGGDPGLVGVQHLDTMADYMELFALGAPWQQAEQRLGVLKIFAQSVLYGSDDMLRTIFNDMHRHHIAVGIEMGAVLHNPDECGGGEGYAQPNLVDKVAGKLRRLGLVLDYWAMDEPVSRPHFLEPGHDTHGRTVCQYPIPEVARRVAINVNRMRQYFPAIQVGTIDVVYTRGIDGPTLVHDNIEFADEFLRQTGRPLAFWHADIAWHDEDWHTPLTYLVKRLRERNITYGVIIGGTGQQHDAQSWIETALAGLRDMMADPAIRPDDIVVQSWQSLPTHMLPETDPETVTYELLQAERIGG